MNDYLQLAIAGMILLSVFYAVWRNGRSNPETTGRLARKLAKLEETVAGQGAKITGVEESVDLLRKSTATSADIASLRQMIADDRDVNDRTWRAVDRIQGFFIEQGMKG